MRRDFCILFCLLLFPGVTPVLAQQPQDSDPQAAPVQFLRDVLPILREHCYECHRGQDMEGDLRLDQEYYLRRGGHTGSPLVAETPEDSELYIRITTADEDLRMPKHGDPLSSGEIATLRDWIEQGAPFVEKPQRASNEPQGQAAAALTAWQAMVRHIRPALYGALVLLVLAALSARCRRTVRRREAAGSSSTAAVQVLARAGWRHYGTLLMLTAAAGLALYFHGTRGEAIAERDLLQEELQELQAQLKPDRKPPAGERPFVYFANQLPRLGGTWYRGNDERNPRLFNGGYYRTATLELSLCDDQGQAIEHGDAITDQPVFVRLVIRRAAFATPGLFRDYIMKSSYLSTHIPGANPQPAAEPAVFFETTTPGDCWEARYQLPAFDDAAEEGVSGLIYVYKGGRRQQIRHPDDFPHYAISYALKQVDGNLSEQSTLTLGSTYHTRNVVFPPDDRIPVNQWFDFQPIPEIVGGNTRDPKLLGIEEHLGGSAAEEEQ
jgi:hypothetical protein